MTDDKLAGVLAVRGAFAEAEEIWRSVIAREHDSNLESWQVARIHLRYGLLLDRQNRRDEAIEQIETAIDELETEPRRYERHLLAARALLEEVRR